MSNRAATEQVICTPGAGAGDTGFLASLMRVESGRLVIRGLSEGGFSCVDLDLVDLLEWFRSLESEAIDVDRHTRSTAVFAARSDTN